MHPIPSPPLPRLLPLVMMTCSLLCLEHGQAASQTEEIGAHSRQSDVIYGRKYGMALTMEVFKAAQPNGLGVLWMVSGGGSSSRAKTVQPQFLRRLEPFLRQGFTVFAVIHGSSPRFHLQDFVQDAHRAVRFVRYHAKEYEVDPHRLAVAGSSSGGWIALMIATRGLEGDPTADDPVERVNSQVQAVGCFFSPSDFLNFGKQAENILDFMQRKYGMVDPAFQFYDVDQNTKAPRFIDDPARLREKLLEFSPAHHVTGDDPPTILIHGDSDPLIPLQQSRILIDRLAKAKVATQLIVRNGKSHAWYGWESDGTLIATWFHDQLIPSK